MENFNKFAELVIINELLRITAQTIDDINLEAQRLITSFASKAFDDKDPNKFKDEFSSMLKIAFGDNYDEPKAIELFQLFAQNNFEDIPKPIILPDETMMEINLCYAREKSQIYINERFLLENLKYPVALGASLVEEYGHYIDSQINEPKTSTRDKGLIFALFVIVEALKNEPDINDKLTKPDTKTIIIDGNLTEVETAGRRPPPSSYP